MSSDRHKRLAMICYGNVKKLLQLNGDVSSETGLCLSWPKAMLVVVRW
jgi:hypothetical protein